MPDIPHGPRVTAAWADAAYVSAIPDFKRAPDPMFNAPAGWGTPDPGWQHAHPGWLPAINDLPMQGYPLAPLRHQFWLPKTAVRRAHRQMRNRRAAIYAFYTALYALGFLALVAGTFWLLYPPAGFLIAVSGGELALLGMAFLWLTLVPIIIIIMDWFYLLALRQGRRGPTLFRWTLGPGIALAVVTTSLLTLLFYLLAGGGAGGIVTIFTTIAAGGSIIPSVFLLAYHTLDYLQLDDS